MSYVEHLVASPLACCTWEQQTDVPCEQLVVPDACVDVIWSGGRLTIAGPDTAARRVALGAGAAVVGVRLRAGVAGAVLGLPATELRNQTPRAEDVLGREAIEWLLEKLHAGGDPRASLLRGVHAVHARSAGEPPAPDPLVRAAVAALDRPGARVASVADELGLSARQLQRRVADAVGYGPKLLARILRFRRLQALAASQADPPRPGATSPLIDLALDAGYADQAHMTAEVTRLAGLPPVRFLKDRTPTAA